MQSGFPQVAGAIAYINPRCSNLAVALSGFTSSVISTLRRRARSPRTLSWPASIGASSPDTPLFSRRPSARRRFSRAFIGARSQAQYALINRSAIPAMPSRDN
jgi:hypothetical protein